jgi:hypothetical protein
MVSGTVLPPPITVIPSFSRRITIVTKDFPASFEHFRVHLQVKVNGKVISSNFLNLVSLYFPPNNITSITTDAFNINLECFSTIITEKV